MRRAAQLPWGFVLLGSVLTGLLFSVAGCSSPEDGPDVRVVAENGAWTWFTDERAIVVDSNLYVGHVDTAGYVRVTAHSLNSSDDRGRDTTVRLSTHQEIDDHDNPALLQLDDGRTLAVYSQHHEEPRWYWRFEDAAPNRVHWSPERSTDSVGANVTYSNLFQLTEEDGRIYNAFRALNFDPTWMTSDDGGQTWNEPKHLLTSGGQWTRPYVKYVSDGEERIDLFFTQAHPRQEETSVYHLFYRDGAFHESDGTQVCRVEADDCLPIQVNRGTLVYDASEAGRAWVWDLEYAEGGTPIGAFVTARDSTVGKDLRYHYAHYDTATGTWATQEIAHAGTRLYEGENHYAGGITLDPADEEQVYLSANVDPETGDSTASGHYQIYRGTLEDQQWTWTQITESTSKDNLRPFVPRSAGGHQIVLWLRGQYASYTNYETDVVGIVQ